MFRLVTCSLLLIAAVSARSRFVRQANQTSSYTTESSGLQFIDFNEGSASNPILARDQEGSGLVYDEEGSGSNLLFDSETNSTTLGTVLQQTINVTDSDVDTLVIKVHLPQRSTSQLLDELKDDSAQQSNPINSLNTAVSLTSVLNELLGRIQDATTDQQ
ncbi:unnamed protein product [Caenorhabditis sp. 36 PRJEB53466]|nr:unnamed protein product [Caenorhabditis sp. 36 PRJEB53466]